MTNLILPTDPNFRATLERGAVAKGFNRYSTDRFGRRVLAYNEQGKPYEACPMCSRKAMVRTVVPGDIIWNCEFCGYEDCDQCPAGIHTGSRDEIER